MFPCSLCRSPQLPISGWAATWKWWPHCGLAAADSGLPSMLGYPVPTTVHRPVTIHPSIHHHKTCAFCWGTGHSTVPRTGRGARWGMLCGSRRHCMKIRRDNPSWTSKTSGTRFVNVICPASWVVFSRCLLAGSLQGCCCRQTPQAHLKEVPLKLSTGHFPKYEVRWVGEKEEEVGGWN